MNRLSRGGARVLLLVIALLIVGGPGATAPRAAAQQGSRPAARDAARPAASQPSSFVMDPSAASQKGSRAEPKLDPALAAIADAAGGAGLAETVEQAGVERSGDKVQVIATVAAGQAAAAAQALLAAGGEVTYTSLDGTQIQAFVPAGALRAVANNAAVNYLWRPEYVSSFGEPEVGEPQVGATTTEGVAVTNANAWHSANQRGAGVKVAIIDGGFEGYASLLGGDLPASVTAVNFADTGTASDGGPHGTACAEIVHDMAPGAQLYLIRVGTNLDLQEAVTYALQQGVDVISSSIGWYNLAPGDGTGFFANEVQRARNGGIFWATAASNDREAHWGGIYGDPNGNNFHEFAPNFEINCFVWTVGDEFCADIPPGNSIRAFLRWDNWSAPVNQDYDLLLVRWNGQGWDIVNSFDPTRQVGDAGQAPTEFAVTTTSGEATAYGVAIGRFSASRANVNFELFVPKFLPLSHLVNARSLGNLADSPGAITVAALDAVSPFPQESYSSEGPSNGPGGTATGGFIKPDLAAFANVNTQAYGTEAGSKFNGTSSATPHVAGAAALVRGAFSSYSVQQVVDFLNGRAIDMGSGGKDTQFGVGRLWLGNPGSGGGTCTGPRTRFDFNGDCRADILWRNSSTGANAVWYVSGSTVTPNGSARVADQNWRPAGVGDFNNDRKADILWRNNSTGANTIWFMNGATSSTTRSISTVSDVNWRVVGTGDFNGDGRSDIMWRHATNGANSLWALNSNGTTTGFSLTRVADVNWQVVGTGDFNGDGRADILWRNSSTGANTIWFMNGSAATQQAIRGVSDLSWKIVGAGDYNADNRSDILWRNTATGANSIWFMNGTAVSSTSILRVDDQNWQVAFDGDFNGDRKADILWRNNATGANTIWFMNGAVRQASSTISRVSDLSWRIVGNASAGTGASNGPFAAPSAGGFELVAGQAGEQPVMSEPVEMALVEGDVGEMVLEAPAEALPADGELSQAPGAGSTIYLPALSR